MKNVYEVLDKLQISYEMHEHPAVFTVEEASQFDRGIDAGRTKNLFLRNKKGNEHFLVIVSAEKKVDLKDLAEKIGSSKLGFASEERMKKYLGLTPGSVSPFGLINDEVHKVHVVVDKSLLEYEKLGFHPNINTATIVIFVEDFKKFVEQTGNKIKYLDF